MRIGQIIYALCGAALVIATSLGAATSKQEDVGVRAIGMGGAFSAVASDGTAVGWNPAAMALLQRQELSLSYASRFGLLQDSYASYVLPVTDSHALGLDWAYQGIDDVSGGLGLASGRNKIGLAYGYRNSISWLRPYIGGTALGLSAKYIDFGIDLDGRTALDATGFGWDFGLLVPLPGQVRLALTVQDLGGTSLKHASGISEEIRPALWRVGAAWKPLEGLTLAADVDDFFRVGAEYWIAGQVALRAGLKSELDSPESVGDATSASFGLGVKYRFVELDYAYEQHPILAATHYTGLALSYNPSLVSIKSAAIRPDPIFRSLYPHYQEEDFFDVVLSNADATPLAVTVSLMVPRMMKTPYETQVVLPAQSTEKYSFPATFDPDLFNTPEAYFDNFVQPQLQVRYTSNRREKVVEKLLDRVYVAGKGKLSWNVPGMAAAFVTPADLTVAGLARGLVQRYDGILAGKFNRSNLGKAALLFDALGVYKLRYQADQKTPFARIADDRTIFDTVQYPSELLALAPGEDTKIGDCDDLTVLYASLLENLGIDTAFLEANQPGRGHIYLMFDSGIDPDKAENHFVSQSEYVIWRGRVWIPVETTMTGFPFHEAWRSGGDEYRRLKGQELIEEVYIQDWAQIYKPAPLAPSVAPLPPAAALDSLLAVDIVRFDQRIDRIALGETRRPQTAGGLYEVGASYLRTGHLDKADEMLDKLLAIESFHADGLNAKGVVMTHRGRYDEALEYFRKSLAAQDNHGVRMNIALVYYAMGERGEASKLYKEVAVQDDRYGDLMNFMSTVGDAEGYYEIGAGYLRQGKWEQAQDQFRLALNADPEYSDAVNGLGVALSHRGDYAGALAAFERAAVLKPQQLGYRMNVALAHHLLGDTPKAEVHYRQVVQLDDAYEGQFDFIASTEKLEERYRVAIAYIKQDQLERALEQLDQILTVDPKFADGLNAKGVVLTRQSRYAEAYDAFSRAAEVLPQHPGIHLNIAIVRLLQGRRNEAALFYRQATEMEEGYEGMLDAELGKP